MSLNGRHFVTAKVMGVDKMASMSPSLPRPRSCVSNMSTD
jgi:hypothetical protein